MKLNLNTNELSCLEGASSLYSVQRWSISDAPGLQWLDVGNNSITSIGGLHELDRLIYHAFGNYSALSGAVRTLRLALEGASMVCYVTRDVTHHAGFENAHAARALRATLAGRYVLREHFRMSLSGLEGAERPLQP